MATITNSQWIASKGTRAYRRKIHNILVEHYLWKYQLYRGETKFPRTNLLTIREAGELNKRASIIYASNLYTKQEAPLWEWRLVKAFTFMNVRKKIVNDIIKNIPEQDIEKVIEHITASNKNNYPETQNE